MNDSRIVLAVGIAATSLAFAAPVHADTGTCPTAAGSYAGGSGTAGSPYQIATPEHLQRLRDDSPSWGASFVVTAIIDMTSSGATCTWESSIGTVSTPFTGTFDGDGREIVELAITPPRAPTVYAGLFGRISSATLIDVDFAGNVSALASADHQPVARAGGIVGWASGASRITGSNAGGFVIAAADDSVAPGDAESSAGGLVGLLDGTSTISGSSSSATVYAELRTDDSTNTLSLGTSSAGGLVGTAAAGTSIADSSSSGSATTYAYGQSGVSSGPAVEARAGGLVGSSAGSTVRSVSTGNAGADGSATVMATGISGGLIGAVASPGSITNSYATGIASATSGFDGDSLAGGLIGRLGAGATVTSSYALGLTFATQGGGTGAQYPGALIGRNFGVASASFSSTAQGNSPTGNMANAGITMSTPEQLKDIATYQSLGWVISGSWSPSGTWALCPGVGGDYPFLTSQYSSNPGCPGEPSPQPAPATPASEPRDVSAAPVDRGAKLSWSAPASSGAFPVSHYLAISTPGAHTCLVAAPALTCEVTGLTNGTAYTFTVKALTGAGWSAASDPSNVVVPRPSAGPSIVITGSRDGQRIKVAGSTTGFGMGAILNPWVRLAGQTAYSPGSSDVLVSMDGTVEWGRKTGKKASVYMQTPDGSVRSNAVTIRARS